MRVFPSRALSQNLLQFLIFMAFLVTPSGARAQPLPTVQQVRPDNTALATPVLFATEFPAAVAPSPDAPTATRFLPLERQEARTAAAGLLQTRTSFDTPEIANQRWRRHWQISLTSMLGAQTLDVVSSWNKRELNPLLTGPRGEFGGQAAAIKFAVIGGLIAAEATLVRQHPKSAKFFTLVNWTAGALTAGLAVHNFTVH